VKKQNRGNIDTGKKKLTSSKSRVEELPNWGAGSMIVSILVLFGEGARGLDGGVVAMTFR